MVEKTDSTCTDQLDFGIALSRDLRSNGWSIKLMESMRSGGQNE